MQSPVELLRIRHTPCGSAPGIVTLLWLITTCAAGCGNSLYALRANAASVKLEEAREAGAQQRAPYEYTLAEENLNKAMSEAAEADYGDAFILANAAYDYADQAVQRCVQTPTQPRAHSAKEPSE